MHADHETDVLLYTPSHVDLQMHYKHVSSWFHVMSVAAMIQSRLVLAFLVLTVVARACPLAADETYTAADLRATSEQTIRVTRDNRTVAVLPDTDIAMELFPSNSASTGFAWLVESSSSSLLTYEACAFEAPMTNRIGAAGTDVFRFHVPRECPTGQAFPVVFIRVQPWQASHVAERRVVEITCAH